MNDIIRFERTVESSFRRTGILAAVAVLSGAAVSLGSVLFSLDFARRQQASVYVLDKGRSLLALQSDGQATRDLEVMDHVTRFHELFFNMAPNAEAMERNINRSLVLSDRSAYDYWADLSEKGFYQRLVQANITQQIVVDSVAVDISSYPYTARCYARRYLIRESNITAYDFESTCRLLDVERSPENPHGLMLEKFAVTRNESLGTRKRDGR